MLKEDAMGEVYVNEAQVEQTRKRRSVRSSEFFGLWKNRTDINSGLSFVRTFAANPDIEMASSLIDTDMLMAAVAK